MSNFNRPKPDSLQQNTDTWFEIMLKNGLIVELTGFVSDAKLDGLKPGDAIEIYFSDGEGQKGIIRQKLQFLKGPTK